MKSALKFENDFIFYMVANCIKFLKINFGGAEWAKNGVAKNCQLE